MLAICLPGNRPQDGPTDVVSGLPLCGPEQRAQQLTRVAPARNHQNDVRKPAVTAHGLKPGVTVAKLEFSSAKP